MVMRACSWHTALPHGCAILHVLPSLTRNRHCVARKQRVPFRAMSLPLRITITVLATIALVWALATHADQYFQLSGGLPAWIVVGVLLTLMNMIVRPVLHLVTLPLKLFATIFAIILTNSVFLWLTVQIIHRMEPELVQLEIFGLEGWILTASAFGLEHWILKKILPEGTHQ